MEKVLRVPGNWKKKALQVMCTSRLCPSDLTSTRRQFLKGSFTFQHYYVLMNKPSACEPCVDSQEPECRWLERWLSS